MKGVSRRILRGIGLMAMFWALAASARPDDPATVSTNNAEGDKAWKNVAKLTAPPMPPPEWQERPPASQEVAEFFAPKLVEGATAARDFYTKFPDHPKAAEARRREYQLLSIAVNRYHLVAEVPRFEKLEQERLNDPKVSDDDKIKIRVTAIERLLRDLPVSSADVEEKTLALQKDYPRRDEPYQMLVALMQNSPPDKAAAIAQRIADSEAPEEFKTQAKSLLKSSDALGKPVDIRFKSLDGREVDVSKLKGKVVLIDFWATWCGPCVAEFPKVKAAYEKFHAKGFEIVGISFDQKQDALEGFIKENLMEWPQYFDGKGWANRFGEEFGIHSIPTMWLVDKEGKLRDMNARDGLEGKVEKLLTEDPAVKP